MALFQGFTPLFEIVLIAVLLNYLLSLLWNTRSMDLFFGLMAFLLIFAISSWLHLPVVHELMVLVGNVAVVGILIIFQPELRMLLSKLSLKGKRLREVSDMDRVIDQLVTSLYRMAERGIGALIVLENEDSLDEYAQKGVALKARLSSELLESIFVGSSPLHDGAVVVRGEEVVAASVLLPLAEESSPLARSMGTRHRAGLGISQASDAVVLIVSEESGKVSLAREGVMTRGVKIDRCRGILRSVYTPRPRVRISRSFWRPQWRWPTRLLARSKAG